MLTRFKLEQGSGCQIDLEVWSPGRFRFYYYFYSFVYLFLSFIFWGVGVSGFKSFILLFVHLCTSVFLKKFFVGRQSRVKIRCTCKFFALFVQPFLLVTRDANEKHRAIRDR